MITAVSGTFNVIHDGHRKLLDTAFGNSGHVIIGITSDAMASSSRKRINPLSLRIKALREYLNGRDDYEIVEIDDPIGPAAYMNIDSIVVSTETMGNVNAINEKRKENGLPPLSVTVVDMVRNRGKIIRGGNIMAGICSRSGEEDAIRISVGSMNPVKIEAVRTIMERIFIEVIIVPVDVPSGVPEQPWGEDTCKGAANRAAAAIGDSDLSVGIEAGVFEIYDGLYDIQHCVILDKDGKKTIGTSSGFRYPDDVAELVRKGMTVGEAMSALYMKEDRGNREGAIGFLSKGLIDRKELTEQSVKAAMIPRICDENDKR